VVIGLEISETFHPMFGPFAAEANPNPELFGLPRILQTFEVALRQAGAVGQEPTIEAALVALVRSEVVKLEGGGGKRDRR
jgi:hypothetical protein